MKDGQLFRVKVIKTVDDLPKEDGEYFINQYGGGASYYYFNSSHDAFDNKEFWLKHIDWYLRPIELDIPNEEEIEKWAETLYSKSFGAKYIQLLFKGAKWAIDEIIKRNK